MPGPMGGVGKSPHLASILDRYRQTWAESSFFWNAWQEMLGKVVSMPSSSRLLICRLATDARGGLSGEIPQIAAAALIPGPKKVQRRDNKPKVVIFCQNLSKSPKAACSNCTRQITGSVDLNEMDCIARRHTHDHRQVSPCKNGDWLRVSRCLSPFLQRALNHAWVATLPGWNRSCGDAHGVTSPHGQLQASLLISKNLRRLPWHKLSAQSKVFDATGPNQEKEVDYAAERKDKPTVYIRS